jgi:hypothetical protein
MYSVYESVPDKVLCPCTRLVLRRRCPHTMQVGAEIAAGVRGGCLPMSMSTPKIRRRTNCGSCKKERGSIRTEQTPIKTDHTQHAAPSTQHAAHSAAHTQRTATITSTTNTINTSRTFCTNPCHRPLHTWHEVLARSKSEVVSESWPCVLHLRWGGDNSSEIAERRQQLSCLPRRTDMTSPNAESTRSTQHTDRAVLSGYFLAPLYSFQADFAALPSA